ncbi:tetratricopeptide repeat protein [Thermodesulfobacteriota bacterium]
MKRIWFIASVIIFFLIACTANLEMRKRQSEATRSVAEAYMDQGKYTEALRELDKAEKLYADDPILQDDLGLVLMQKKKLDLAIPHFKKALELKPDFPSAKNNLGVAYLRKKEWEAAIACFKELTENLLYATPQNPLVNMGLAYYNKGEYAQSETYYKKALKFYKDGTNKDITYIKALHGLGRAYMAMGRVPEAVAMLKQAIKTAPRIAELFFDLGQAYVLIHEYQKAVKAFDRVVELVPERALAQEALKAAEKIKKRN